MPRLWNDTLETHRMAVRDAVLDAVAIIVSNKGLSGVTMSQVAESAGIGRATLYKYFPDLKQVMSEWHEREIGRHLRALEDARDAAGDPATALQQVLHTYARVGPHRHRDEASDGFLHDQDHSQRAHHHLHKLVSELIAEAALAGAVRSDVPAKELTHYCLSALSAGEQLSSPSALDRLVTVVLDGLGGPESNKTKRGS